MKKQRSYKDGGGALYLVPTPIGNLEDITYRALRVLQEADVIASEDTRNTQKLLNHFEIKTPQISFHEHNYKERIPVLIERLKVGEVIAQVSDAGMPSVSDPGHELVVECIASCIPVIAIPGATAGLTALIASGLSVDEFKFCGFLPRKKGECRKKLESLKSETATLIFYESPYRIKNTVEEIAKYIGGNRQVVVCRELTKVYEEYLRGTADEVVAYLAENTIKGECCLLVEGADGNDVLPQDEELLAVGSLREQVQYLVENEGATSKEAIKKVAKLNNLKKQDVYAEYHSL